jgi:hypothetical protein
MICFYNKRFMIMHMVKYIMDVSNKNKICVDT